MRRTHSSRRGSVLYLALLAVIALAGLSLAMVQIGASFSKEVVSRIDDERALYLAEAALAESVFSLRNGGTGSFASAAAPARYGYGMCWADAVPIDANRNVITIAAAVNKGRAAIEAVLTPTAHPAQQFAVFSNEPIIVEPSSMIDSFDSTVDTYANQLAASTTKHVNENAVLASNSSIHVENPSTIWGDAQPGPDQLATADNPSAISGSTTPSESILYFDPVIEPAIPPSGTLTSSKGKDVVLPAGDYNFTSVTVGGGSKMTIEGPCRILVDDWTIKSNSEFVFDATNGPIEWYVSGTVDLASNSTITTPTKSALATSVYLTGGYAQDVTFNSNSDFYGTIYGPEATVTIDSNFEVFGAVAANAIVIAANTYIHYDEALLNGSAGQLLTFAIQSWRRVEFPLQNLRIDRRDPFQVTGLDPALLGSPASTHVIAP